MRPRYFMFAAALACAGVPALAHAGTVTSGSGRLVGYTLTDLAPGDGVAPSVTFTRRPLDGGTSVYDYDAVNASHVLDAAPLDAHGHAVATQPGAEVHADVNGQQASTWIGLDAPLAGTARAAFIDDFVLSPYTRLTLTFAGQVDGTHGAGVAGQTLVDVSVMIGRNDSGMTHYDAWSWNSNFPQSESMGSITFDVATGGLASEGYVAVQSYSTGAMGFAQPVPEPRAWAMLAAGLLVGALPAWRRRVRGG